MDEEIEKAVEVIVDFLMDLFKDWKYDGSA